MSALCSYEQSVTDCVQPSSEQACSPLPSASVVNAERRGSRLEGYRNPLCSFLLQIFGIKAVEEEIKEAEVSSEGYFPKQLVDH